MMFYVFLANYVIYTMWMLWVVYEKKPLDYITSATALGLIGLVSLGVAMDYLS
jgi:hypothetical protein